MSAQNTTKRGKGITDGKLAVMIIVLVLVIDQIIKIWVKTHMHLGESIEVTNWFYINFIENIGMAYGMTLFNKLVLSIFRLIAISAIAFYMVKLLREEHRRCYVVFLSMILAGAAGNMLDSMFYGLIFNASSPYYVSYFVPFGTGYAPFLQGKVVDMFYFPLIVTTWPDWVPIWGGEEFIFFSPVFNFADASISVGIILLIIFCRKDLEGIHDTLVRGTRFAAMLLPFVFLMTGCKPQVPGKYIQPSKMEDILFDYHLADAMASRDQKGPADSLKMRIYKTAVLDKHGYTEAEFDSSMHYYIRHTERLHKIYDNLSKRLSDKAVSLGASTSDINKYASLSASGDTANIWNGNSAVALLHYPGFNVYSFDVKVDTAFHAGDRFLLNFDTQFVFQDGMRDAVAVLTICLKNDSVISHMIHASNSSHQSLSVQDDKRIGVKSLRGYFILNRSMFNENESRTTLKLLTISNITLVRMHTPKEPEKPQSAPKDSLLTPQKTDSAPQKRPLPAGQMPMRAAMKPQNINP